MIKKKTTKPLQKIGRKAACSVRNKVLLLSKLSLVLPLILPKSWLTPPHTLL